MRDDAPPEPFAALRGLLSRPLTSYYLVLATSGLLLSIGLVMVLSASSIGAYENYRSSFASIAKQGGWAILGLVVFWFCQRLPVRSYRMLGRPLVAISAALLLTLLTLRLIGVRNGPLWSDGLWLYVFNVQLQPVELAKLALLLWVADVLVRGGVRFADGRELAMLLVPLLGMLVLVGYNDLGSMLTIVALLVGLLWTAGLRLRAFVGMAFLALVGVALLVLAKGTDGYRWKRFTAFLDPQKYADSSGYNSVQAYYAIANGGWWGVGLGGSSQKWDWLPNPHNDFIFAIIAEELGVVGCFAVLSLIGALCYAGYRIARRVDDPFRRLVAAGCTTWLAGQSMINIGAVVGLLPVTGVPLPFISDGGSALVVALAAVGMLASFARAEPAAARALHARPPGRLGRILWAPLPPLPPSSRRPPSARKPTTEVRR